MKAFPIPCLRVDIDASHYVLIIPESDTRSFFLCETSTGRMEYMFGCAVADDQQAVELAANNGPEYISSPVAKAFHDAQDLYETVKELSDACEDDELSIWLYHAEEHLYEAVGGLNNAVLCDE
jgi:hypothetical protein